MFEGHKIFKTSLGKYRLVVEIGKMASNSESCLVRWGDTVVLVAVTSSSSPRLNVDFLPLSIDFEERFYSVGKIPGSYVKREGKPSEKAILAARQIDRALRPLFPKDFYFDVLITCSVFSIGEDCLPETAALIGSSICLSISNIPWSGPISVCEIGFVNGEIIEHPNSILRKQSDLKLTIATSEKLVVMLEVGANRVSEEVILKSIKKAFESNLEVINFIKKIVEKVGKSKVILESCKQDGFLKDLIKQKYGSKIDVALSEKNKSIRDKLVFEFEFEVMSCILKDFPDKELEIKRILYDIQRNKVRGNILEKNKRVDGRELDEIRPIAAEVDVLPRVHGSALFTRGSTQVLTVVTLGLLSQRQIIDDLIEDEDKFFIHHYNFLSYSVGETRPNKAPTRREIGHGAFVERALSCVMPNSDEFPYTVRLVSEVLSSNGSTSQASVCASSLSLMDAGVPISEPVAGISCGLVSDGKIWRTFIDIQGIEDFFGDMDFKIAGTKSGITAIQMDTKTMGLSMEIIEDVLEKTKKARLYILDNIILKTISGSRPEISPNAPKIVSFVVPIEKIRDLIGSGGKVVQSISLNYNVKIDVKSDGKVYVISNRLDNCIKSIEVMKNIIKEIEPGDVFKGKVCKITDFGVFVEFVPGKEGLCHISKLSSSRKIVNISDYLAVGDLMTVRVVNVDEKGRVNFRCLSVLERRLN